MTIDETQGRAILESLWYGTGGTNPELLLVESLFQAFPSLRKEFEDYNEFLQERPTSFGNDDYNKNSLTRLENAYEKDVSTLQEKSS